MEYIDHSEVIESDDGRPLARLAIGGGVASAGLVTTTATGVGGPAVHHMLSLAAVVAVVATAVFASGALLARQVCQTSRRRLEAAEARRRTDLVMADEGRRAEVRELIVWHSNRLGETEQRHEQHLAELQQVCQRERDAHRADLGSLHAERIQREREMARLLGEATEMARLYEQAVNHAHDQGRTRGREEGQKVADVQLARLREEMEARLEQIETEAEARGFAKALAKMRRAEEEEGAQVVRRLPPN